MKSTVVDISALGPTTDVRTACRHIGISGSYGYELVKRGEFPCRVIKAGNRFRVVTASLLELLAGEQAAA
jgi:hypothetical protein